MLAYGTIETQDGWRLEFDSPIQWDTRQEWDEANEMYWSVAWVPGFEGVSKVVAEQEQDLADIIIPEFIQGTLCYPPSNPDCPCEFHDSEEYRAFYNYIRCSVDRIQLATPRNMRIKGTLDDRTMELEFV